VKTDDYEAVQAGKGLKELIEDLKRHGTAWPPGPPGTGAVNNAGVKEERLTTPKPEPPKPEPPAAQESSLKQRRLQGLRGGYIKTEGYLLDQVLDGTLSPEAVGLLAAFRRFCFNHNLDGTMTKTQFKMVTVSCRWSRSKMNRVLSELGDRIKQTPETVTDTSYVVVCNTNEERTKAKGRWREEKERQRMSTLGQA
jgi:hypothetical protein